MKGNQTRKNRLFLRGAVGVWNCESGDRIKGCDGTCLHAIGSLAGAGGWSITNVAAFSIFPDTNHCAQAHLFLQTARIYATFDSVRCVSPGFQHELGLFTIREQSRPAWLSLLYTSEWSAAVR